MAILLTILKILGIVILALLGLILLIILIVLFFPISYRITAVHNDERTSADAKVAYLILKALGGYHKGEGLDYKVKVLFFQILPKRDSDDPGNGNEKKRKRKKKEEVDNLEAFLESQDTLLDQAENEAAGVSPDVASETGPGMGTLDSPYESFMEESQINTGVDPSQLTDETVVGISLDDGMDPEEYKKLEKKRKKQEKAEARKRKKEDKNRKKAEINGQTSENISGETEEDASGISALGDKVEQLMSKIDAILDEFDIKIDKADAKYQKILVKVEHVLQFLEKDFVQRTIKRVFNVLKKLLGTVKPKKSKGYLHFGLSSAADTGEMLGRIAAFYPLYGRWLDIEPDFYNKGIEGDIDIKGRIYLFRFVFPLLGIALTRDFWRTFKLAKKI